MSTVSSVRAAAMAFLPWVQSLTTDRVIQIVSVATKTIKSLYPGSAATVPATTQPQPANYMLEAEPQGKGINYKAISLVVAFLMVVLGRTFAIRTKLGTVPRYNVRKLGLLIMVSFLLKRITSIVCGRATSPIGASLVTRLISKTLAEGRLSSSQQRQVFVDLPIVASQTLNTNHTHGNSARDRNSGSATAALAAQALGLEPYYIQMSLSDIRKGRQGDRSYHWAKDIAVPAADFHFDCLEQAAVLVDVDHYIDMPTLLARHPGTYLISTFQPTAAAKSEGEYTYRFLSNGSVEYRVSGGALYIHQVWDYRGDTFLCEDVGIINKTIVSYHIDRKRLNDNHTLILLSMIGKFEMPSVIPTTFALDGARLERLKPVCGNHVVLDVVTQEGMCRSIAVIGQRTAVTLPIAQLDAVHAVAITAKVPITPAMVASNIAPSSPLGLPTERLPPGHAAIIASYVRAGVPHSPPVVYAPEAGLVPISFSKHDYDAKVPLKAFGSPLIGPCYTYVSSLATDDRCIRGRVEAFISRDSPEVELPIPPSLAGYMVEFAKFLIPVKHRGHPVGHDEVRERQDRPSQRSILDNQSVTGVFIRELIQAFVKKEAATSPSDPRNISQMPRKLDYATIMYAFHEGVMVEQEWYAFGKTPKECAERVCSILTSAKHCVLADGSRFDGHVKRRARILERILMLRFFHPQHHSLVNETMDAQIGLVGFTTEGRRYNSGYTRGSGSQETSDFNSVETAFIDYCAWRNTTVDGIKCDAETAWRNLGIYGGDDSLAGAVDPDALKRTSVIMGQEYEITVVNRGDIGVNFLNRWFGPDVWNGDPSSMANPPRLLSKLWVGPSQLANPIERFAERVSGYYRMDKNSPVIGPITMVAHLLLGEKEGGDLAPWDGRHPSDSNWPNDDSGWMMDLFNKFIPDFDHDRFTDWLDEVAITRRKELLLQAPLCTAAPTEIPTVKTACVVGDDIAYPPAPESVVGTVANETVPLVSDEEHEATYLRELFPSAVPREVVDAAKLVPLVGTDGLKTGKPAPAQSPRRRSRKGTANAVACPHPVKLNSKTREPYSCPCTWVAPSRKPSQTKAEYDAYLATWRDKRAHAAKKCGLKL